MEERRISMLYLENLKRRLTGLFSAEARRSPAFPIVLLFIVLIVPAGLWFAHTRAYFHKTKQKINDEPQTALSTGPGGRDPVIITRNPSAPGAPEFVSATILPGLGLDILQITARIPGKGDIPLLVAPSLDDFTTGSVVRHGPNDVHGALEAPWGGILSGLKTILGTSLMLDFQGNTFSVPTDDKGVQGGAEGGLLQNQVFGAPVVSHADDAVTLTGSLPETDFDGHWRSKMQVQVEVRISGKFVDITSAIRNVGEESAPMGLGWHPRFQLGSDRADVRLRIPQASVLEISDRTHELPTGKITAAGNTLARFMDGPEPLRNVSLDEALVRLKNTAPTSAEIQDPAAGYGLRLTAVSSNMRELRVFAPSDGNFVSLGFQTNFDNPLGHVWTAEEPAIAILQPGQTLEYKVRLEILPIRP
ncbi:MAG: hypothetical protein ACRYGF_13550 [Janthinobacterium lividum]